MTLKIQEYRLKYTTSQLLLFSNTKPNINITVTQHRIRLPGAWDMPCTIEIDHTLVVHALQHQMARLRAWLKDIYLVDAARA